MYLQRANRLKKVTDINFTFADESQGGGGRGRGGLGRGDEVAMTVIAETVMIVMAMDLVETPMDLAEVVDPVGARTSSI